MRNLAILQDISSTFDLYELNDSFGDHDIVENTPPPEIERRSDLRKEVQKEASSQSLRNQS
jgi:hypothetical protein